MPKPGSDNDYENIHGPRPHAAADTVDPDDPDATTASAGLVSAGVNDDYVSVYWVESWGEGGSSTWVPKTVTYHFNAYRTQAPLPGKGEIGMGTLTAEGAAPTQAAVWVKGVAAAVGVGLAGMIV